MFSIVVLIIFILLNLLVGVISSLILSGRISQEEEKRDRELQRIRHNRDIKVGCIMQSRAEEEVENDNERKST